VLRFGRQYGKKLLEISTRRRCPTANRFAVVDPADTARPARAIVFASGLARPVDLKFAPDGSLYCLLRDAWVKDQEFRSGTGTLGTIRTTRPERPVR
jgi:hypothetical protein